MSAANFQLAARVSRNCIIVSLLMTAFKLFAGIYSHSSAMISDALHSLSDVLSACVVLIGVRLAGRESDKEHPYGHERMECAAAIILSVILFATGAGVGYAGLAKILTHGEAEMPAPGLLALIAAAISIAVNEAMYWYTRSASVRTRSGALMAEAWHHRSDSFASIGSFIGVAGARLGFPALDSMACVIICLFISKVACTIFIDSINKMTDKACDDETISQIRQIILLHKDVLAIDRIRTRLFGDKICVDVEIGADARVSFQDAHEVANRVQDAIKARFPTVKHCMVHMNPVNSAPAEKQGVLFSGEKLSVSSD